VENLDALGRWTLHYSRLSGAHPDSTPSHGIGAQNFRDPRLS
jgi:hypothetical protein